MIAVFKKAEVREDLMFVKDNMDRFLRYSYEISPKLTKN
jgi:hypothetical protein